MAEAAKQLTTPRFSLFFDNLRILTFHQCCQKILLSKKCCQKILNVIKTFFVKSNPYRTYI